jgi:hypothetical protein
MCEVEYLIKTELNSAIAQFRRFEDASLEYAGGRSAHDGDEVIGCLIQKLHAMKPMRLSNENYNKKSMTAINRGKLTAKIKQESS